MPGGFDDHECGTCGKEFPAGWAARDRHCQATGHRLPRHECSTCSRWFDTDESRVQHMGAVNHFAHKCALCPSTYPTEARKERHERHTHLYCADCARTFQSANNLEMVGSPLSVYLIS